MPIPFLGRYYYAGGEYFIFVVVILRFHTASAINGHLWSSAMQKI